MSPVGSLAGRQGPMTSRVHPLAGPSLPGGAPADGPCLCGQGPQADTNGPYIGSGSSFSAIHFTCPGVGDMRLEVTVNSWSNDDNDIALHVRMIGGYEYFFTVTPSGAGPTYPNSVYELQKFDGSTSTIAGPTTQAHPAPGDILELSAVGTSVIAKLNGTPMFSVTDSSVVQDSSNGQMEMTGGAVGTISVDVVYEDYCP